MILPQTTSLCDASELAAIILQKPLSLADLTRQFFPGQNQGEAEEQTDPQKGAPTSQLREALRLAISRQAACGDVYPFNVSERCIEAHKISAFNPYVFMLLGRGLNFGGPEAAQALLQEFRIQFEDVVCWAMRQAGFVAEVLSEPRGPRGLHVQLVPALRELAVRFGEAAVLRVEKLEPHDNDLDVDVLAVPVKGNAMRGHWPVFLIQCATGALARLQAKVSEGATTFTTVWENGFSCANSVRGGATPDDLLALAENHWNRLCEAGWILDRTRIAYLASCGGSFPLPNDVSSFWEKLWAARKDIDWLTGWQAA